ncbi:4Fe-4S binding protein [Thiopseudomonas sp. CY1220]|uniref:4Fe-4S binding protein n=2 Tax=Thiopseudomonas acetoxidans TaxID=3041622 RepID=A0ABT7SN42_9GAMM|nr:NosR/NirI family protein [Thiopseudomonas sp. CY1220]MDM7857600.1 4Fe-4S binding protein [Thiopseudomonas sp. CY1220]
MFWTSLALAQPLSPLERQRIATVLPEVNVISEPAEEFGVRTLKKGDELQGYAFESINVVNIPAYSGKPINMQVVLGLDGTILDAYVLHHDEPILLIGIPEQKLHDFAAKYQGINVEQRVVIGRTKDETAVTIDAVSGATVTVMVVNEIVMRAAHRVAVSLGLVEAHSEIKSKPATILKDYFRPSDWHTLTGDGSVRRMLLNHGQVDDAFIGTEAEGVEAVAEDQRDTPFIDLYLADLTVPTIGRNILGDKQYQAIMEELNEGDHAMMVVANGDYSFKGSGYVRGGIFDRIQMRQFGEVISFRDLDFFRLSDVYAQGMPNFTEMGIFIARSQYAVDPGSPLSFELLVRRQTGPVDSIFTSFELGYQLPEEYIDRPALTASEQAAIDEANRPLWLSVWYQKSFQISIISIALIVLVAVLFMQDFLARRPGLLHTIRIAYLTFTVVFIGWYALGQISVVNVFTFVHSFMGDFRWETFLIDPVIFIMWSFVAVSILLWGRGVFCGWLCPFGALQELINEAARKLKVKQYELPWAVHERLWAVKYIILLALFGLSLDSIATAEKYAEVEPFKTAITLHFVREWGFVLYAVVLLVINIFTRKVYCRYICPLGAALAIPTQLRLFDWLKRRKECGTPCQLCAVECEVQAIHPDGHINANECHHCLDCQVTYYNDDRCPPLVAKKKRRQRNKAAPEEPQIIPAVQLDVSP